MLGGGDIIIDEVDVSDPVGGLGLAFGAYF